MTCRRRRGDRRLFALAAAVVVGGLRPGGGAGAARRRSARPPRPSILLVTLDTTRADAIGPEARGVETPAFDALAARGLRFRQAYATVPETLPSHASLLTGLHPAGHGVHENARYLGPEHPLLAERLGAAGYDTAAFVSSFVLARRFGLARGFEHYDDDLPAGRSERSARETTDRALAWLDRASASPGSPGCTTSTRTPPTSRRSPSGPATRRRPTWARWRPWTSSWGASSRPSSSGRRGRSRSSSRATTARGSGTTGRPSTATSSTSRRCTSPSSSSAPASRRA